jgi:preprotein translocase subunit SecD
MTAARLPLITLVLVSLVAVVGPLAAPAQGSRATPDASDTPVERPVGLQIVDTMGIALEPGTVIRTTETPRPVAAGTPGPQCGSATPGTSATPTPAAGSAATAAPSPDIAPGPDGAVYVTIVGDGDFARIGLGEDQFGGPVLAFALTPEAADRFYQFTSDNIGRPMAIVLDGVVLSAPIINGQIAGEGVITGPNAGDATAILERIRAHAC